MNAAETRPLPESAYQLLLDPARTWPDVIATQWIPDPGDHTRCLAWTYAEQAGTATRIAELLAWAATAIDEPAARPKRIYPIDAIPVTAVGKHFKPALAADAAIRAITEALAAAGVAGAQATAAHENGRLVLTVTGADPGRVRDAAAGPG